MSIFASLHRLVSITVLAALSLSPAASHAKPANGALPGSPPNSLWAQLPDKPEVRIGDIIFIHVRPLPFEKVSQATGSWVNHVGVVVGSQNGEPLVAESTVPFSRVTPISRFIARSAQGRFAIRRLVTPLQASQLSAIQEASRKRMGIAYDTGFNIVSSRQFCSRFVREVIAEATGQVLGEVQSFNDLFAQNPKADLAFWRTWFFGSIPWERRTVTPASIYTSPALQTLMERQGS